jgi:hypothetical protein
MKRSEPATSLPGLEQIQESLSELGDELRGKRVLDSHGKPIGKARALVLDEGARETGFLEVETGGLLGLGAAIRLIPVEAIAHVTRDAVQLASPQERANGPARPASALAGAERYYDDVHEYYRRSRHSPLGGWHAYGG